MASFCGIVFKGVDNMLDQSEAPVVSPEESQTMSENVFRRIQAAIVKGEIAPGSKISEPELARTYGISRGPLREAIHRLEGQRLLVRVPHVGARVVSLNQTLPAARWLEHSRKPSEQEASQAWVISSPTFRL